MAGAAAVGYAQGSLRAACSLIGILVGALLAMPLGRLVRPLMPPLGLDNPLVVWGLGPIIAFIVVLALFKVAGAFLHRKVDVYYKYKAGDLRLALFLRLNARLGACIGMVNGIAYTILIALVVFPISYFTTQVCTQPEQDGFMVRMVNRMGADLQATGVARAVRAVDPVPPFFYEGADFIALLYHNPLTHGRIGLYPPFLRLGDKGDYSRLGEPDFAKQLVERQPFGTIANDDRVRAFWSNPATFEALWTLLEPDLPDLVGFIRTGKSAKYDAEPILGKWYFDTRAAMLTLRRAKPNITATQLKAIRLLYPLLDQAVMVASPDGRLTVTGLAKLGAVVKTAAAGTVAVPAETMTAGGAANNRLSGFRSRTGLGPRVAASPMQAAPVAGAPAGGQVVAGPTVEKYDLEGRWQKAGDTYELSGPGEKMDAAIEGIRLTINHEPTPFVFEKEVP
jgi:hypothetical protein